MTLPKPTTTGSSHTLPFDKLSPRDFERLCFWLVHREGFRPVEHLGAAGKDQGRDIVAWLQDQCWAFQCKRVRSFHPAEAETEVDKVLGLPEDLRPAVLVFLVTCDVSAETRHRARARCAGKMDCHFWALTELDEKAKRYEDVLREFFSIEPASSLPSLEQVLTHRAALVDKPEYSRWDDEFYIREEGKVLPLLASPYDDDTRQQREDLLQTIRTHARLLVLGEPGMGKTVALQRMMWETAQADVSIVPVLVRLIYFQGNLFENVRVALNETGVLCFDDIKIVRTFLRNTRCLVMFDGLNEVAGKQRSQALAGIANFLLEFPRHRYVVTSRSQDELWKRLRTSSEAIKDAVVIQRITDEQARRYLIAHLGDQKGCELHDRLNECLRGLSRTPLLLWMIKEAGLAGEELPGNRGELFDRFVDRILERDEKLEPSVPASAKKRALANLAFDLQQRHQLACTLEHAVEVVDGAVRGYDAEMVLKEILIHGLLQGERQVRFLHQSVQEYFVGLHLCKIAQVERKASGWQRASKRFLRRNLARWARDDWWAESFVQMAGLTDDSSWLARELAPVKPWLAFWCSIEGRPVDKKTKALVEADTIALLHSKDAERRLRALAELGRFENPRTIEYLIQALEDDADGVVDAAIHILAEQGEPAVEPLLAAVQGGARTRRAATRALGQIWRMPDLVRLGDSDRLTRRAAVEPLGETGNTRVLEPLIAVLKDSDATVRQKATEVLAKSKDARTLKLLIAALEDPDQDMRCSAVEVLGEMGDSRAVEPLIQTVGDQTEPVGRAAVKALGKIGDRRAVGRLITALKYGSSTSTVRREAAEALGKLGDSQAVQPLIDALKDSDESVRRSTIEALGKLGDPRAVRPLIHALGDENELVCQAAVEALGRLGGAAMDLLVTALKDSDRKVREGVAKTLGKIGDIRAVRPLVNVLKDSDERVRQAASDALGKINDVRAVDCLITYLRDSDGNVRSGVAKALGRMGGDRAVPPLAAALEDGDRNVRQSAVEALGNLGGEQVVASLIRALGDRERMVRQAAIDALERVCNAGVMWRLIAGLKSGDKNVRWGTTKVLGSLGDAQAVEPLIAALKDSEGIVRLSAVEALGKLGDARAVKPLISVLEDGDGNVRSGVAKTLGNLGDARAVDPLISALWDGETRVQSAAADALGKLEDVALHRLTALLVRAIRTDNRDMQWSVLEALRRIGTPAARDLVRQYDAEKRRNWKTP